MANVKRLIDANALRVRMFHYYGCVNEQSSKEHYNGETLMNYEVADMIEDCIENAPTVDAVEVVHGRWLDNVDENGYLRNAWRKCSACGGLNFSKRPPYCPNCGAKMDGGTDDERAD